MKHPIRVLAAVVAALASTAAFAHGDHRKGDHWHGELTGADYRTSGAASSARIAPVNAVKMTQTGAASLTDGEVRRVDLEGKKVTLKHGEIRNLDMPPMTMAFAVKDEAVLAKLKVGDKVRFGAVKEGSSYIITDIVPAP